MWTRHFSDQGRKLVYDRVIFGLFCKTMSNSVLSVISRFLEEYTTTTPNKLKVVDAYLLYILLTGALQFLYCVLVGTFPFNSFLSGFISCVGSFILAGKSYLFLFCLYKMWLWIVGPLDARLGYRRLTSLPLQCRSLGSLPFFDVRKPYTENQSLMSC